MKQATELVERRVHDLGTAAAAMPRLKAMLAAKIAGIIADRKLTVRAAEELTGFAAADFSRVRVGKIERFTVDRLIRMLARLDPAAEISASIRARTSRDAAVARLKAHESDLRK